ncbi:rox1p [Moniliophthora roreri]|nr:rox1p [Moniliophthora roreri]
MAVLERELYSLSKTQLISRRRPNPLFIFSTITTTEPYFVHLDRPWQETFFIQSAVEAQCYWDFILPMIFVCGGSPVAVLEREPYSLGKTQLSLLTRWASYNAIHPFQRSHVFFTHKPLEFVAVWVAVSMNHVDKQNDKPDGYTNSLFVDVKPPTIRERAKIKQRREYSSSARIVCAGLSSDDGLGGGLPLGPEDDGYIKKWKSVDRRQVLDGSLELWYRVYVTHVQAFHTVQGRRFEACIEEHRHASDDWTIKRSDLSLKAMGKRWRALPPEENRYWEDLARKKEHAERLYPGYVSSAECG